MRVVEYGQEAEHHERGHAAFHGERAAGHDPSVFQQRHRCGGGRLRGVRRRSDTVLSLAEERRRGRLLLLSSGRERRRPDGRRTRRTAAAGGGCRAGGAAAGGDGVRGAGDDAFGGSPRTAATTTRPATAPAWRHADGARRAVHVRRRGPEPLRPDDLHRAAAAAAVADRRRRCRRCRPVSTARGRRDTVHEAGPWSPSTARRLRHPVKTGQSLKQ